MSNSQPCSLQATQKLQPFAESAARWLLESGVQNTKGPAAGSFNAWYEEDSQSYPFVYSEITGYMITTMCELYERTQDARYLDSAKQAAQWLLGSMHAQSGAFRCLFPLVASRFDFKKDQIYAFDNGVIVNGLVQLYRITHEQALVDAAQSAAEWLMLAAQKPSGAFFPVYQSDEGKFFESDREWSMCSGSYHAKIAIGLLNLFEITGDPRLRRSAERVCDSAMQSQNNAGRFVVFLTRGGTNAHPHCYAAEGLWVAGKILERPDYLEASAKATRWLLDLQDSDGRIPRLFIDDTPNYHERLDAIAQTARLAILHQRDRRLGDDYDGRVRKLFELLVRYQSVSSDSRSSGGVYFGRLSAGDRVPHVNTWVTAFAQQAANCCVDGSGPDLGFDPFSLI